MNENKYIDRITDYQLGRNENGFYTLRVRELNKIKPTITIIHEKTICEKGDSVKKFYSLDEIKELSGLVDKIETILSGHA
jgi:hypothetical protein